MPVGNEDGIKIGKFIFMRFQRELTSVMKIRRHDEGILFDYARKE